MSTSFSNFDTSLTEESTQTKHQIKRLACEAFAAIFNGHFGYYDDPMIIP